MARSAELNARPSSLPAALDAWRDWLTSEKRCAAHTLESYNRDIGDFLAFLDEHLDAATDLTALAALRQSDFRAWLAARGVRGLKRSSTARALSAVRGFFGFLERRAGIRNRCQRNHAGIGLDGSTGESLRAVSSAGSVR